MASHIKKDGVVEVISGDHKGQQGKVLRVIPDEHKVIVEGVNMVYRHVRPSRRNPQGGRLKKEAALHISNVLPVDPRTGKGSRVRFEMGKNNKKQRVTVGGTQLDQVTTAGKE